MTAQAPPRSRDRLFAWLSSLPNLVVAVGLAMFVLATIVSFVLGQIEPTIFVTAGTLVTGGLTASAAQQAKQSPQLPPAESPLDPPEGPTPPLGGGA